MSENPEKEEENFSEEQQAIIDEQLAKWAAQEIPAEKRRECGPEVEELEAVFENFEQNHDLAALRAITNLTPEETLHHPVREPARQALMLIQNKL
jgi:hypothetical protein